ncbi:MAG: cell envelope protein SmpA [Caulobacter sp.]|nr:cell envelope protein SmpA [Caulobacter sp.]
MYRKLALAAVTATLLGATGACVPITSYSGFQAIEARPADVKVGEDTKSTVMEKLGSPSASSTFDPNVWFYITQVTDQVAFYKPRVAKRDVVAITFDKADQHVLAVNTFTLRDGKVIAYNGRETPTRGRELSILEQLLGNLGRGGILPQDDDQGPGNNRPNQ